MAGPLCVLVLLVTLQLSLAENHDAFLTTSAIVRRHGYPSETHTVLTEDGYLITMHRIPHSRMEQYDLDVSKPVVFLQHGDLGSSADWILLGPSHSLGFSLADSGYDVWMGNSRGNAYSQEHIQYPKHSEKYWQFSWDQLALLDLPAEIEYILETTGRKTLDFVGYSLGATIGFALMAADPKYNRKINLLTAIAPTVYLSHTEIPERVFAPWANEATFVDKVLLKGQVFPQKSMITGADEICTTKKNALFCDTIFYWLGGNQQLNQSLIPVIINHFPAGSSAKVLQQISQQVDTGRFCKFDYGDLKNTKEYKSLKPPSYDLRNVRLPVAVIYSKSDMYATPEDVENLIDNLPNVIDKNVIGRNFHHFDFVYSSNAKKEVNEKILKLLRRRN